MIATDAPDRLTTLPVPPLVAFTILVVGSVAACALMMWVLVARRRTYGGRATCPVPINPAHAERDNDAANVTLALVAAAMVSAAAAAVAGYSLLKDDSSGTSSPDAGAL